MIHCVNNNISNISGNNNNNNKIDLKNFGLNNIMIIVEARSGRARLREPFKAPPSAPCAHFRRARKRVHVVS